MSFFTSLLHSPDTVFPDRMLSPRKNIGTTREITLLVSGLFLFALLPRAIMAWQLGAAICNDGHYYIWLADSLEKGDIQTAVVSYLNLNIYPVILVFIHKLGFDWIIGGKIWGVLVSSLVVFPMFGWVREQYNEQIATVACFLYAIHPELIEWSAEPIREPTFWFLTTCCLFFMWRSVMGLKLSRFVIAGITLALAIHTRSEGWLLVPLLIVWTFFRFRLLEVGRKRLLLGTTLSLAMIPLLILLMNVTLLRNHSQWEFGRFAQVAECYHWVSEKITGVETTEHLIGVDTTRSSYTTTAKFDIPHPTHPLSVKPKTLLSQGELFLQYQQDFFNSMGPFALLFLAIGLFVMFRDIFHRDKCVFLPFMLILMLGVWIRLSGSGSASGRFFLLAYFLVVPCGAIGVLFSMSKISKWGSQQKETNKLRPIAIGSLLGLLIIVGWVDSLSSNNSRRKSDVLFGNWLRQHCKKAETIVTESPTLRVSYAVGFQERYNANLPNDLWGLVERKQPEMVILLAHTKSDHAQQWREEMTRFFAKRTMSPVPMEGAPEGAERFLVFIKTDSLPSSKSHSLTRTANRD